MKGSPLSNLGEEKKQMPYEKNNMLLPASME